MKRVRSLGWLLGAVVLGCGGGGGGGESAGGTDAGFFGGDTGTGGGAAGTGGGLAGGGGGAGGIDTPDAARPGGAGGGPGGTLPPVDAGADAGCGCPGAQTCDPVSGACVEPAACTEHADCLSPRTCVEGQCRDMCRGDGDCPAETHCDPGTQACIDGARCADDTACGEGRRCEDGACLPACTAEPCPGAQTCDEATGRCNEPVSCGADIDCLPGRVCRDQVCLEPCVENAMCPGAQTCVDGRCTEPAVCHGNLDCQANRVCSGGVCQAHCAEGGCAGDQVCDPSGVCFEAEPCEDDAGCFAGRRCVAGRCANPCVDAAGCPGALLCDAGECVEGPGCVTAEGCLPGRLCLEGACVDPCGLAGCPGALRCDEESGLCEEDAPCRDDSGCLPGRTCVGGACSAGCVEAAECPGAMACEGGRCVEPPFCRGPLDCHPGRVCTPDGSCQPACDAAHPCSGTLVCEDGLCVESGQCVADRDCLNGRVCNPQRQTCAASCADGRLCPPGELCSPAGFCQPPLCGADEDCAPGLGCLRGVCLELACHLSADCAQGVCADGQCLASAPGSCDCPDGWACTGGVCFQPGPCAAGVCPAGWVCQPGGDCGLCDADADCGAMRTCVDGFCAEPARCAADLDCLPGRDCGPAGTCQGAACLDDDLSPNHAPDFAAPLGVAVHLGRVACPGQDDWYRVGDPAALRVIARFDSARRPLTLELYPLGGAFGPAVDRDPGVPGMAAVEAPAGSYLLRVTAPPGAEGPYSLEVTAGLACVDDAFERPWRNDVEANAATVGLGRHAGTLCAGDEDFFQVDVGGRLRLALEGAGAARVGNTALPATVDGPATVRITGGPGAYTLVAESEAAPAQACAGAANAALNASFDATVAGGARDDFAAACHAMGGAERVFRLRLPNDGQLRARMESFSASSALLLFRDCAAAPLVCSGAMGDLLFDAAAGDYFLVVEGPYAGNVRVDFAGQPPACNAPPRLEPDAPTAVRPAGAAPFPGACLSAEAPTSLLRFSLEARTQVSLSLTGGGADALLGLRGTCGSVESLACAPGNDARIETALDAGEYFVTVQGAEPMQLTLRTAPPAAGLGDACDAPAVPLARGESLAIQGDTRGTMDDVAGLCGAGFGTNDQIFRFSLAERADVVATVDEASFNARFYLTDGDCAQVEGCPGAADRSVRATLEAGEHALVIDAGDLGQAGTFRATLRAE